MAKELLEKTNEINNRRLAGERISIKNQREELNQIRNKYRNISSLIPLYKNLVRESNSEIAATKKLLTEDQKRIDKLKNLNNFGFAIKEILGEMGDLGKYISELRFPDWTEVLRKGIKNFLEYDKVAFSLRKSMGLLRGDFDVLQINVKKLGINLQDIGISFEQIAMSTGEVATQFNMFVASSSDIVKNISVIASQLGIAEHDSVKFYKTMASIGKTTLDAQQGMVGFAKELSNAAGIPLPLIMRDIADAGDDVRIFTSKTADSLIKSTIQARQMGTTLQNMVTTSKRLLDFQSSIVDEMEASVLLGRDINLQQARNLAYRKDFVAANKEILNIAKKIDFSSMDPYQAESFARATGKSVQELQEMLQIDKELDFIRNGTNQNLKDQLAKVTELKNARAEEAKNIGKSAEMRLRQQANQERIIQLQNQFNKLMSELSGPVMELVSPLLDLAVKVLPTIANGILKLTPIFGIFKALSYLGNIKALAPIFASISGFFSNIIGKLGFLGKFIGFFGKILGFASKILGPIGLLINAVQLINSFIKHWQEGPKGFLGGLIAIKDALKDVFLQPFIDAYNWISGIFVGKSPSKLGLGILKGIQSIQGMLLDSLTYPFISGFNRISGLFGGLQLPKVSELLTNGPLQSSPLQNSKNELNGIGTIITESNKKIVDKIDELITLMENGAIGVQIDGSKASTLLARAQKERGAFGSI
jgi:hypothetical protein